MTKSIVLCVMLVFLSSCGQEPAEITIVNQMPEPAAEATPSPSPTHCHKHHGNKHCH